MASDLLKKLLSTLLDQYDFGLFISINWALASSNRYLFLHDATPFWSGIYARDVCTLILFYDRYELNSSEMYSQHRCQITILQVSCQTWLQPFYENSWIHITPHPFISWAIRIINKSHKITIFIHRCKRSPKISIY